MVKRCLFVLVPSLKEMICKFENAKDEFKSKYKNGGLTPPKMDGWKWLNDGTTNKKLPPNAEIPEGWVCGRCGFSENKPMKNKEISTKNAELRKKR